MFAEAPTRHSVYYLDVVIIRVENKLFKIPKEILTTNSPVFADMFSMPSGEGEIEGHSDTKPLHLEQVTSTVFERLLDILYPIKTDPPVRTSTWGEAEWMSVLSLADKWQMSKILNMALENLRHVVPPTTKISFGQRYDYPTWIVEGFVAICTRAEPISEEEGRELGTENLIKCFMAREKLWEETARTYYEEGARASKVRPANMPKRIQYGATSPKFIQQAQNIVRDILGFGGQFSLETPTFLV